MLAVVLLPVDVAALYVLGVIDAGTLPLRHHAVGLGSGLHVRDMLLAALEARRFAIRQLAGSDALLDTLFLARLACVDAGSRLGEGGNGHGRGENGDQKVGFHFLGS